MSMGRLLLLSNSRNHGEGYLEYPRSAIREFLGRDVKEVLFIPYAAIRVPWDQYAALVQGAFREIGYRLRSVSESADPVRAVNEAEAIAVGGGNTFHLLRNLRQMNLIECIRARVREGMPYIGWSAGSNVACPSIKTTNDMPVVDISNLAALDLIPFQINPHYADERLPRHQGETRAERIAEFTAVNPKAYVVGLREGGLLRIEGSTITLLGKTPASIFLEGADPRDCAPGESLQFLMKPVAD